MFSSQHDSLFNPIVESAVFTQDILASNNERLMSNLKSALVAANIVRNIIKHSSTHPSANLLNDDDKEKLATVEQELRDDYIELIRKIKNSDPYILPSDIWKQVTTSIGEKAVGRCGEYGLLTMRYLSDMNLHVPIEIFNIKNGNHTVIVIDRDPNSSEKDYNNWGENAVVCDSWSGRVFPANQIEKLLVTYGMMDNDNIYFPFLPKVNELFCNYSFTKHTEAVIEKIKEKYRAPIINYLKAEIQHEKLPTYRKVQFEQCLKKVENLENRFDIKNALSELKQALSTHHDKGCAGFFKATWARKPASYHRFENVFDDHVELKRNRPGF